MLPARDLTVNAALRAKGIKDPNGFEVMNISIIRNNYVFDGNEKLDSFLVTLNARYMNKQDYNYEFFIYESKSYLKALKWCLDFMEFNKLTFLSENNLD